MFLGPLPSLRAAAAVIFRRCYSSVSSDIIYPEHASVACLSDSRGVLQLSGPDVIHFLNGIITQNPSHLADTSEQHSLYTAFLNAQGRFLHDAFFYPWSYVAGQDFADGTFALLADVRRQSIPQLLKLITRYKLRSKVDISDVSDDYAVWVRWGGGDIGEGRPAGTGTWPADPRNSCLGLRTILHRKLPPGEVPGGSLSTLPHQASDPQAASPNAYRLWRWAHGIAEGDDEIPSGQAVPLEFNLDGLNAIDFHKGCYVGQELIARTHFRGVVHKRLMPFRLEGSEGVAVGMDVVGEGFRRPVGKVHALEGDMGLATLRLEAALKSVETGISLGVGSESGRLKPWRPSWWPAEWGHESDLKEG